MKLTLGIDAGGTFTDAVIYDRRQKKVLAFTKKKTRSSNLTKSIAAVLDDLPPDLITGLDYIALSTTLATNATVENRGSPTALLLIGYDRKLLQEYGFIEELGTDTYALISGGHDIEGRKKAPLDREGLKTFIRDLSPTVETVAVSSYFSIYNSSHEDEARRLITSECGLPVVCGHELSGRLNSIKRASTAVLNARLIPRITELMEAVSDVLFNRGIDTPLYIVKGDGSICTVEDARRRPVETIFSGPAASAVGARELTGFSSCLIADIGGTTTDFALIEDDRLKTTTTGTVINNHRTHVNSLDMRTIGLGGDSHFRLSFGEGLELTPKRVLPICRLARRFPQVGNFLRNGDNFRPLILRTVPETVFYYRREAEPTEPDPTAAEILNLLSAGPRNMREILAQTGSRSSAVKTQLEHLVEKNLVGRSGFTPTDYLHCTGRFTSWDAESSHHLLQIYSRKLNCPEDNLLAEMEKLIIEKFLASTYEYLHQKGKNGPEVPPSFYRNLARFTFERNGGQLYALNPRLNVPLILVGAPAANLTNRLKEVLGSRPEVPDHFPVANAVGAASGNMLLTERIEITPTSLTEKPQFRVLTSEGAKFFTSQTEAADYGLRKGRRLITNRTEDYPEFNFEISINKRSFQKDQYLKLVYTFQATGRPGFID